MNVLPLKQIGLTSNEALVYATLCRSGELSASELAEKTNLHRSRVYVCLERIQQKGLINVTITNKIKRYSANSTDKLFTLLKQYEQDLESFLPQLQKIRPNSQISRIENYIGIVALKGILLESLNFGDFYVLGAPKQSISIMGDFYWKNYNLKARDLKLKSKMIFNSELKAWSKQITELNPNTKIKFLDKKFDNITETIVYKKSILLIIWTQSPIGILIKDPFIAKAYKNYFDLLWSLAKK